MRPASASATRSGSSRGGYKLLTESLSERMRSLGRRRPARERVLGAARRRLRGRARRDVRDHRPQRRRQEHAAEDPLARHAADRRARSELDGRVGALLEVGTGFHPELTGRENVFLNGAILGMTRAEIARKFDEIVEFAEVERFIDTPVKRYSSGMQLRLAFAVAAHLEPEILIIDEVLSVGDLAFQEKCLGRMETVAGEGRTVLFVSHNLTAVSSLCPRSMLLESGTKVTEGPTTEVIESYVRSVVRETGTLLTERTDRGGTGGLRFSEVAFESGGRVVDSPATGEDFEVVLRYETARRQADPQSQLRRPGPDAARRRDGALLHADRGRADPRGAGRRRGALPRPALPAPARPVHDHAVGRPGRRPARLDPAGVRAHRPRGRLLRQRPGAAAEPPVRARRPPVVGARSRRVRPRSRRAGAEAGTT